LKDLELEEVWQLIESGLAPENWKLHIDGSLRHKSRISVPVDKEIRTALMDNSHCTRFTIHPRSTKMYQDLKRKYWWKAMKHDVADYVAKCSVC
jgi:hypothetical protein